MHHKPALEVMAGAIPGVTLEATAGTVPGVTPEVKAGVMAGLTVGVALRVDDQGPPPDFNLGGG